MNETSILSNKINFSTHYQLRVQVIAPITHFIVIFAENFIDFCYIISQLQNRICRFYILYNLPLLGTLNRNYNETALQTVDTSYSYPENAYWDTWNIMKMFTNIQ